MTHRPKIIAAISVACLLAVAGGAIWAGRGAVDAAPATQAAPQSQAPQHIASLNLCTDQLLLALADRQQIAALTPYASDASMSAAADLAKSYGSYGRSNEELLTLNIDMLVGMPATGSPQAQLLNAAGEGKPPVALLDMPWSNSYADIQSNLRLLGDAIGKRAKADALIRAMDGQLESIKVNGRGRVAAYYQRRGFMTGTGTLVDDMMRRLGLVNLAEKLGKPALEQLSLEEMVMAQPDFLIYESASDLVDDQGSEMLHHPALRAIPRLTISEALTVCGGPEYPNAIRILSAQIAEFDERASR